MIDNRLTEAAEVLEELGDFLDLPRGRPYYKAISKAADALEIALQDAVDAKTDAEAEAEDEEEDEDE